MTGKKPVEFATFSKDGGAGHFNYGYTFRATEKMFRAVSALAKMNGMPVAAMFRTMVIVYLDSPGKEVEIFSWRDERQTRSATKQMTLGLTKELDQRMKELADYLGVSQAQIVRIAVMRYLSNHPAMKNAQNPA